MNKIRCRFVDASGKILHYRKDVVLPFSQIPRVDDYIRFRNRHYLVIRTTYFLKNSNSTYVPVLDLFLGEDQ